MASRSAKSCTLGSSGRGVLGLAVGRDQPGLDPGRAVGGHEHGGVVAPPVDQRHIVADMDRHALQHCYGLGDLAAEFEDVAQHDRDRETVANRVAAAIGQGNGEPVRR